MLSADSGFSVAQAAMGLSILLALPPECMGLSMSASMPSCHVVLIGHFLELGAQA